MITVIYNRHEVVNELRRRVVRSTGSCNFQPNPGTKTGTKKKVTIIKVLLYYIFQTRCLLEKALPEPSLRYLSKAYALYLSLNAM